MQLLIGECSIEVGAREQARLNKVLTLMEIGTGLNPAELAQIKGSVLTMSVGKWTIEGNRYCTSYKGYGKTCYTIEMAGSDVTLTEKSGQGWRYELLQGNPKKL